MVKWNAIVSCLFSINVIGNKYTLFNGLTYNTRRYFACCIVSEQWVKCPHVLHVKPLNKGFIIPMQIFPAILLFSVFALF